MSKILDEELAKYTDPAIRQSLWEVYADGVGDGYEAARRDESEGA